MLKKNLVLALLALVVSATAFPDMISAQENPLNLQVKSAVYGSSQGPLPFWMHSNRDGKMDSSSVNWVNEIAFSIGLFDYGKLSVDAGGNLVGRLSNSSSAHFNELYLHADLGGFRLSGGRFINPIGLNNHDLSAGSMMVSRNATPVPRISLYTPEFLDVPFLDGYLQYKGLFNHGWLEDDRFVSKALLHQKYLYLKVNVGSFSGTGGMIHNVVWGGRHPDFGQLPQSFGNFLRVVAGQSASESSNAPGSDISNALGNAVAAYEFALEYHQDDYTLSLTRLFYLEDRVSTRFRSPWDGVWGLNLILDDTQHWLKALTYEHINTKQQDAKEGQPLGRANYYNNSIYRSGWTYERRVLGLPLLSYNPEANRVSNNILVGHHLGMKATLSENLSYTVFFTYSRNYGDTYSPNEHFDQFSGYLGFRYAPPGMGQLQLFTSLAADWGEFYSNNLGLSAGIELKLR